MARIFMASNLSRIGEPDRFAAGVCRPGLVRRSSPGTEQYAGTAWAVLCGGDFTRTAHRASRPTRAREPNPPPLRIARCGRHPICATDRRTTRNGAVTRPLNYASAGAGRGGRRALPRRGFRRGPARVPHLRTARLRRVPQPAGIDGSRAGGDPADVRQGLAIGVDGATWTRPLALARPPSRGAPRSTFIAARRASGRPPWTTCPSRIRRSCRHPSRSRSRTTSGRSGRPWTSCRQTSGSWCGCSTSREERRPRSPNRWASRSAR